MPIACVVYICELKTSPESSSFSHELANLFRFSRAYNKAHNITSALFVNDGTCIQFAEGETPNLNQLMANNSADSRQRNLRIVYSGQLKSRIFPEWNLKLLARGSKEYDVAMAQLERIHPECFAEVLHQSKPSNINDKTQTRTPTPKSYFTSNIGLNAWPKASQISLDRPGMRLCSLLIGQGVVFDELVKRNIYPSNRQLIQALSQLDALNLLKVEHLSTDELDNSLSQPNPPPKRTLSFAQALRDFIRLKAVKLW